MNIITKFTLGSREGRDTLLQLTRQLATEKFSSLVDEKLLNDYINKNFNPEVLIAETNNMSNQWLVVYADDIPAGYACITARGQRPHSLEGKRAMRIADFGILKKYEGATAVRDALFDKCLSICKPLEGIWIIEYVENPLIPYFESKGFIRQENDDQENDLPLEYVCLIG